MRGSQLAILVGLVASLGIAVRSQEPPPVTFKVDVNYVEVGTIVTDAQGHFVGTLGKDDFQIFEDGRPQKVAGFSLVDIPVRRASSSTAGLTEADVSNNAGGLQGRLYLVVLDDLHTDLSRTATVKAAARRFIERNIADDDLVAVVTTSGRLEGGQDFTSNRRLLVGAIDGFVGQKLRSAVLEKLDSYQREVDLTGKDLGQLGRPVNDAYDVERGQRARNTLLTIKRLAESLSGVHGRRKAMVYIGEGIDYSTTNFEQWRETAGNARTGVSIEGDVRDAITAASRSNVSIYTIDPRGLTNMGDTGMEINYLPQDPNLRLDSAGLLEELRLSQDSLRVLAEQTGGVAWVNSNDLAAAFDRVASENSSYYMLGYYPASDKRDGGFRKIEVRVTRPGLQVRARKGYVSPRKGESPATRRPAKAEGSVELADALSRPIQTGGLTLHANSAAFKGAAPNTSVVVTVTVDGAGFTFAEKDGWIEDKLEVSVRAIDSKGTIRGSEHFDLNIRIRPESRAILMRTGFRVVSKIDVPSGKYDLHVGARESGGGTLGTIFTNLEVPDFATLPLSMSNLVLSSVNTGGVPTGRAEQLRDRLPIVPSTLREFRSGDELQLFAEVYDNQAATPHTVDLTTSILAGDAKAVVRRQEQRSSADLEDGTFRYAAGVPLTGLGPGVYSARLEAASRLDQRMVVVREVQFRVTP
ncbi:MAG: VWA domain-containing protein [Vicinamibacterales bacterium]|nr:VWA domain-containing protein [Vicinamibacterales bacterium]